MENARIELLRQKREFLFWNREEIGRSRKEKRKKGQFRAVRIPQILQKDKNRLFLAEKSSSETEKS